MKWTSCWRAPRLIPVLLTAPFLSGCPDSRAILADSLRDQARADVVEEAVDLAEAELAAARQLPDQPGECRKREAAGVSEGDRLDVAALKLSRALGRANARITFCADFYDRVKTARAAGVKESLQ